VYGLICRRPSQILVLAVVVRSLVFECYLLSPFWFSSFSVNALLLRFVFYRRQVNVVCIRAPLLTWARQNEFRLALVALLAYMLA
jgi:hypothetical protein